MLQLMAARIRGEEVAELREWLRSLERRRSELRHSYETHGTRHELFLLVRTRDQPLLVIIADVHDEEEAARSFLCSQLPIDLEFKSLFQEIATDEREVELLYDSSALLQTS